MKDSLNHNFSEHVVINTLSEQWHNSPSTGVDRIYLERDNMGEFSIASSIVKFSPNSSFDEHIHDSGEEIYVLDGTFSDQYGDLGPVYGQQWRNFQGIDQLNGLINDINKSPDSRRLIVSAWNPRDIPVMEKSGLPPCHTLFQFYVAEGKLSCQLYQRSADVFLGVPFNIASYALLTMMIAQATDLKLGDFVHTFGDAHLYVNHLEQVEEQLSRRPHALPNMQINPLITNIFDFQYTDFQLNNYDPEPAIPARVAV